MCRTESKQMDAESFDLNRSWLLYHRRDCAGRFTEVSAYKYTSAKNAWTIYIPKETLI